MAEDQKHVKRKPEQETEAPAAQASGSSSERRSTEEVDKLIADIDEVLEENAEEFVRSYVQKGGE